MKSYILLEILLLLLCLSKQVLAKQAVFCPYGSGASGCLDSQGKCTNTQCQETCLADSECFFKCCVDGYCKVSECDTNTAVNVIIIVVPVVFGVFILLVIICCIVKRQRMIQQRQVAVLNANLNNNNNQIGLNNQFQQAQMQDFNAIMLQQQQSSFQQKPFQTQQQPYNSQALQMGNMPQYQGQQNVDKQQLLTKQINQNTNNGGLVSYI